MKYKYWKQLQIGISMILLLGVLICCDKEESEEPDPRSALAKSTWKISGGGYVKKDGVEMSNLSTLEITFLENGSYTSTGGTTSDQQIKVFLPTGTWSWQGSGTAFLRDGILTQVTELSSTTLIITFTMNEEAAGDINDRKASIVGRYEVKFVKK